MARKIAAFIFAAAVIAVVALYLRNLEPISLGDGASATAAADYTALITEESGFLGVVTVTDTYGEALYKWQSSEGYVLSAAVSPRHDALAVLTASKDSPFRLRIFSLQNETEQGSIYMPDQGVFYDIKYLDNNRIALFGSQAVIITDGFARDVSRYPFEGKTLTGYSISPDLVLTFEDTIVNYINGEWRNEPIA
ncbi:MAG: hypothetical protein LBN97_05370 [Oscillospiraceae bacterium]|jgi:hypothetical protein|nr:hypothetical protein [Oscillospiraceae bacterium]